MISLEDCVALSSLTADEIGAVARHESLPDIVAIGLGEYLLHQKRGAAAVRQMIADDVATAERRGDLLASAKLKLILRHFVENHPQDL